MTTWDPANTDASIALSGGNLVATSSVAAWRSTIATGVGKSSGKWYWRTKFVSNAFVGLGATLNTEPTNNFLGATANSWLGYLLPNGGGPGNILHSNANLPTVGIPAAFSGDWLVVAWDAANGKLYFTSMTAAGVLSTNWNITGANPATNSGGIAAAGSLLPGASFDGTGLTGTLDTTTAISDPTLVGFLPFDAPPPVLPPRPPGYSLAPQGPDGTDLNGVVLWVRRIVDVVNRNTLGKVNATIPITLVSGASQTTVIDARISVHSALPLTPLTADAAAIVASVYVSSQQSGMATFTHTNTANTDQNFRLLIIG